MGLRPSDGSPPQMYAPHPPIDGTFVLSGHRYALYRCPPADESGAFEEMLRRTHPGEDIAIVTLDRVSYFVVEEPATGGSPSGPVADVVECLTERELQIVALVASGKGNKEVADRLHISEWTVATHLRRVFAKLGVTSRAAMVFQCAQVLDSIRAAASRGLQVADRWRSKQAGLR